MCLYQNQTGKMLMTLKNVNTLANMCKCMATYSYLLTFAGPLK